MIQTRKNRNIYQIFGQISHSQKLMKLKGNIESRKNFVTTRNDWFEARFQIWRIKKSKKIGNGIGSESEMGNNRIANWIQFHTALKVCNELRLTSVLLTCVAIRHFESLARTVALQTIKLWGKQITHFVIFRTFATFAVSIIISLQPKEVQKWKWDAIMSWQSHYSIIPTGWLFRQSYKSRQIALTQYHCK